MRRFFVIFGIVLMVSAFVILTVFIILPSVVTLDDVPLLKGVMQLVACKPNEVLSADYSTYDTPTSSTRSTDLSCVDKEQNARDVSQQLIGIGAVGYLGPFLIGLFMSLLAGAKTKKTSAESVSVTSDFNPETNNVAYQPISAADDRRARKEATRKDRAKQAARKALREDREQQEIVDGGAVPNRSTYDHARTQDPSPPLPDHTPLAQRLQELKDAREAGLITEAEYADKRREVLDKD